MNTKHNSLLWIQNEGKLFGTKHTRESNLNAILALSSILESSLGPKGRDKMIQNELGQVTITNDGAFMMQKLRIQHPGAKILVDLALSQDEQSGDGTTSSVLLCSSLMRQLYENNCLSHYPIDMVIRGLQIAKKFCCDWILDFVDIKQTINWPPTPETIKNLSDTCKKVAMTSLNSKILRKEKEYFSDLIIKFVSSLASSCHGKDINISIRNNEILRSFFQMDTILGGEINETQFINHAITFRHKGKVKLHSKLKNTGILLIHLTEDDHSQFIMENNLASHDISHSEKLRFQLKLFIEELLKGHHGFHAMVALVCSENIQLKMEDISSCVVIEGISSKDLERLSRALKIEIVSSAEMIQNETSKSNNDFSDYLKKALSFEQLQTGDEILNIIKLDHGSPFGTFLVRAPSDIIAEEVKRSLNDAFRVCLSTMINNGKVLPGGGAIEFKLHQELLSFSLQKKQKDIQPILQSFAESLLVIPRLLIKSMGHQYNMDYIMTQIRDQNLKDSSKLYGINVLSQDGIVCDTLSEGIFEDTFAKMNMIQLCVESCIQLLRIDNIILCPR